MGGRPLSSSDSITPSLIRITRFAVARNALVVGDQDDRDPFLLVELLKDPQDLLAGVRVEVSRRFVGKEQRGTVDQGPGDGHALLLSAGKLRGLVVQVLAQADLFEQLGPLRAPRVRQPVRRRREGASSRFRVRWCGQAG